MKRRLLLIIICFSVSGLYAQTQRIDSLKRSLCAAKTGNERLNAILSIFNESDTLPVDSLWAYALKGKTLATQLMRGQAYSLSVLAQAKAYFRWGNADSARALVEPELLKYSVKDPASRVVYFKLAEKKIDCVSINSNYKDGMPLLYDLLNKALFYKDSVVAANSMNTFAAWSYDRDELPAGRNWAYKALSYTKPNDPRFYPVLTGLYATLGDNYRWIKRLDSASYCINKAIALCYKQQNMAWLAIAFERQACVYTEKKQYTLAEKTILKSLQTAELVDGKAPQQDKLMVLAWIYEKSGRVDQAIKVMNDGIAAGKLYKQRSPHAPKGSNDTDLLLVFYYQELAKCYRLKGDFKQYAATLEKIIDGKDAFYKANSASAIAELETKYEVQKKEATIARQRLVLAKDGYMFWGSVIFSALAGVIIWLAFRDYRRKQKIRLQRLQEEEKRISAQAVAEAEETERKRIAADLHDNLGAQLSFIKRNVNFIIDQPNGFNRGDEKKYLGYVKDIAQNAMIDLRETIWVLNKDEVEVQEFTDKLKSYLRQQLLDKDGITWAFQENIRETWKLSSGEVMHLFRIVQELISNIVKHAGGDRINIEFNSEAANTYLLTIADNGRGFNSNGKYEGHYGLENIQQRAREVGATLSIESEPAWGTKVILIKGKNTANELYNQAAPALSFDK